MVELTSQQQSEFLRQFGHNVEALIYKKFGTKDHFIRETGFYKKSLHDILTGGRDSHISTVLKLAKALEVEPHELLPKDLLSQDGKLGLGKPA